MYHLTANSGPFAVKFLSARVHAVHQPQQCLAVLEIVWEELGISISDVGTSLKSVPTDS